MSKLPRLALLFSVIASLAACGGGGGSAGSAPPIQAPDLGDVNVANAWHNYLTTPQTWDMPGKAADGTVFQVTVQLKPAAASAFPVSGASSQTTGQAFRFSFNTTGGVDRNDTFYFNGDNVLGVVSAATGECGVARAVMPALPAAGSLGSNGALFVLDNYDACATRKVSGGTSTVNWSIDTDAGVTMFCLTTYEDNAKGVRISTEVDCVEVDRAGTLGTKAKFALTLADGRSLVGRNF
ncbi:MAG: hypothetical protein ABIT83_20445 [Massilia sp.]